MTPLKQRNRHDPANGVWGDCHRAAIASILNMPLDGVPHFGDGGPDGEEFLRRERTWLARQGLYPVRFFFNDELAGVLNFMALANPGFYYLLGGTSRNGVNHTVVCLGGAIVHDPSLNDSGIVGPCDTGLFEITVFGCARAKEDPYEQLYDLPGSRAERSPETARGAGELALQ